MDISTLLHLPSIWYTEITPFTIYLPFQSGEENPSYSRTVIHNQVKHKAYWIPTQFVWLSGTGRFLSWLLSCLCISKPLNTELIHLSEMQRVAGCLELNNASLSATLNYIPQNSLSRDVFSLFHNWEFWDLEESTCPRNPKSVNHRAYMLSSLQICRDVSTPSLHPLLNFSFQLMIKQRIFPSLHWYCNFHSDFYASCNRLLHRQLELWGAMTWISCLH